MRAVELGAQAGTRIEPGTKVIVSGLDSEVTSEDLKEIFESIGDFKKATIFFDQVTELRHAP